MRFFQRLIGYMVVLCLLLGQGLLGCTTKAEEAAFFDPYVAIEEPLYYHYLQQLPIQAVAQFEPVIIGNDCIAAWDSLSGRAERVSEYGGLQGDILIWNEEDNWYEWTFTLPQDIICNIEVTYYLPTDYYRETVRALLINGEQPFTEAGNITFPSWWRDEGQPGLNSIGDETLPDQERVKEWKSYRLMDKEGFYSEPLRFHFPAGENTLRLENVNGSAALALIRLTPVEEIPSYQQIAACYPQVEKVDTQLIIQAEDAMLRRTNPETGMASSNETSCQPQAVSNKIFNTVGGWTWRTGGQSIVWEFEVPEAGVYQLAFRAEQSWNNGLPSYRRIEVDGRVPFRELLAYQFSYSSSYQTEILSDVQGQPYLFYLDQGTHTLTLTAVMGQLGPVLHSLKQDMTDLSAMIRNIKKITGSNPDQNYDYNLERKIPGLMESIAELKKSLQYKVDLVSSLGSKTPALANSLKSVLSQMERMEEKPDLIPKMLSDLDNTLTTLGTWYKDLRSLPLSIDYMVLAGEETKIENPSNDFLGSLYAQGARFINSFTRDYQNISNSNTTVEIVETIDVWVALGMEWANLLTELADKNFTPQTGIQIRVNVLPASQLNIGSVNVLLQSIASGNMPDVAIGTSQNTPVELAIRDAVYDMSQFSDFDLVAEQFISEVFVPYQYQGGVYGMPEIMDFKVLLYRKDIIEELGVPIPETWQQVYDEVIPKLYQNNMQFWYPQDISTFLLQHGANYYTEDGMHSALNTPQAYEAFKEYTELFTNYGVPISANLFNRMRTGEMPMGVGGFGDYIMLSSAAPELQGKIGVALLPGRYDDEGNMNREVCGVSSNASVILNTEKKDASWQFMKWWISTETQEKFAQGIEARIGMEARWATANLEAFKNLNWDRSVLSVVLEEYESIREIPNVLGGLYTNRYIVNAWNKVVVDGESVRDSLEYAYEEITKELEMKQKEYKIIP